MAVRRAVVIVKLTESNRTAMCPRTQAGGRENSRGGGGGGGGAACATGAGGGDGGGCSARNRGMRGERDRPLQLRPVRPGHLARPRPRKRRRATPPRAL